MLLPLDVAWAMFVTALVLGIAPGPDIIFVLTQSAVYGARAGLATMLGLCTGLCFHTAAVALGIAVIFQESALAFMILKCAGAAYLLYLAWQSFRCGSSRIFTEGVSFPGFTALWRRGVIMNITNPKVSLFFLALLPQFADPARGSLPLQFLLLGLLMILATLLVFSTAALLGGRMADWFNRSPRGQMLIHRIAGCIFIGLAVALIAVNR